MADLDDKSLDALLEKHTSCTDCDVIQELVEALREARAERDAAIAGWNAFGAKIAAVTEIEHDLVNLADQMHGGGESVAEADGRLRNDLYTRLMDLAQSLLPDADSEIGVDGLYYEGE